MVNEKFFSINNLIFMMLGVEPKALCMLGKYSTT
jgi:hypothetical protein